MTTISHFLSRSLVACALAVAGVAAHAISFTPIEMDFSPSGRGATQVFRLENTTPEPAAIEVSVKARAMAANGDDVLSDADDQFNVFPAQVVLQPGQVQTVRVQYVGAATIESEKAFRLIAEQLPIDVGQAPQNGGRMRLLVKYVASVYVVPRNVKAVLSVADTQLVSEGDKRWLQIQLRNDGGTRKILKGAKLEVAGQTLVGEQLKGLEGENMLAGAQRTFRLPAPVGINAVNSPARLLIE